MILALSLSILLDIVALSYGQRYQDSCSYDRMRRCRDDLSSAIQQRITTNQEDTRARCSDIRKNFNCLLRETKCLSGSERSRNGDIIRKGLVYIRDGCDTLGGGWRDSPCFMSGNSIKECEDTYPLGGGTRTADDVESCRKYNLFEECVREVLRTRCRYDDEQLLGQYLVDRAQERAWSCGDTTNTRNREQEDFRDRDRDRDSGHRGLYDRDRNRDSWRATDDRNYGSDRNYDTDRYGTRDRNYQNSDSGRGDISCCRSERCDRSRMQQCRDSLSRTVDNRASGYQDIQKCRKARDDFNCLLWQTSNCLSRDEKDRVSDVFHKAKDYMSRYCDTYGRWNENSCYKSESMKRCESSVTGLRAGAQYESCRSYNTFYECMMNELRSRCTREDELYQGAYVVDKAQELSWQCGGDRAGTSSYNNPYNTNDRRNQYSPYGSSYEEPPTHLDDDDAMCQSRMQTFADQCKTEFEDKRRQVQYNENDFDVKQRKTCCSTREYRKCLYDVSRRVCLQERTRVVNTFLGRYGYELTTENCRNIYDYDCSAAHIEKASLYLVLIILCVLSAIFVL